MQLKTTNKPEMIVAVISQAFDDLFEQEGFIEHSEHDAESTLFKLTDFTVVASRNYLEDTPQFRQYLPYVVFSKMCGDIKKYFVYRRTKKVGEERLAGNISVGIGGHVELKDFNQSSNGTIDLFKTLEMNQAREISEEVSFQFDSNGCDKRAVFQGFIKDNSNGVGAVHLGVVYEVFLQDENIQISCNEQELETIGFMSLEEISTYCKEKETVSENWTKLYLEDQAARLEKGKPVFLKTPRIEASPVEHINVAVAETNNDQHLA